MSSRTRHATPSPAIAGVLLDHAGSGTRPPDGRRVYVNRNLRLETVRTIGFDLDWTLAAYDRTALQRLIFELALDRLVSHHGYAESVREARFQPDFSHRGLIIDRRAGTVLKMNRHRYVGRAYMGRDVLAKEERLRLYRKDRIALERERFYWVDTLFELPEVNLYSELVERIREGSLPERPYDELFVHVREAVDGVHAEGPLKDRIAADLPRYLPRDPDLPLALARLALGGRRLVVVTNSDFGYTDRLLSYLLDGSLPGIDGWRQLFDLVVVAARKPTFFREQQPFLRLDDGGREIGEGAVPEWGALYSGGSLRGFMELLGGLGEHVLYVGDHIYGDVVSSKQTSTWRTALIVQELEDELMAQHELTDEHRSLDALKQELAGLGQRVDDLRDVLALLSMDGTEPRAERQGLERELRELEEEHRAIRRRARRLQSAISAAANPTWGSVFKQGGSQSLFGSQAAYFACLYTSRVSNFAYYGTNHYFRVLSDPMPHEHR